jgi:hypothetical protein
VKTPSQKSLYVKPARMPIASLAATTAAGPSGMAETNCFFSPSFTGGMKATNMTKQIRC